MCLLGGERLHEDRAVVSVSASVVIYVCVCVRAWLIDWRAIAEWAPDHCMAFDIIQCWICSSRFVSWGPMYRS